MSRRAIDEPLTWRISQSRLCQSPDSDTGVPLREMRLADSFQGKARPRSCCRQSGVHTLHTTYSHRSLIHPASFLINLYPYSSPVQKTMLLLHLLYLIFFLTPQARSNGQGTGLLRRPAGDGDDLACTTVSANHLFE